MIEYQVERLLAFAQKNRLIEGEDVIPARNALLDLLGLSAPYGGLAEYQGETATEVLDHILDYACESGLIPEDTVTRRDAFAARVMGLLIPRQSEVVRQFRDDYAHSPTLATDSFYKLSRASNYIQVDRVAKDVRWKGQTDFGELEITINLSKPEKDPREIAAAKTAAQTNYPKCLLCAENAGFAGTLTHPARQNHRIIPLTLNGEGWYLQYSPYVYYDEHCIVLDEVHRPMQLGRATFVRLLDFVGQFPHYFLGSNADLPIVGGSILSHDHFQGGRYAFPMEVAPSHRFFAHPDFRDVQISLIKWPLSVIRLAGENRGTLTDLAMIIFEGWRGYSDPSAEIMALTGETPHNTATPIARKNATGSFELDLVLRNNRTTAERPLGLFHPGPELHHIKKENIGLIEVMGLAVLPGRLLDELKAIEAVLCTDAFDPPPSKTPPTHCTNIWIG